MRAAVAPPSTPTPRVGIAVGEEQSEGGANREVGELDALRAHHPATLQGGGREGGREGVREGGREGGRL